MSENRLTVLRALRPLPASLTPRRSLTRRALELRPAPPTVAERLLGFDFYRYLRWSILIMVALPVAIAWAYYAFVATPLYIVETRFAVREASDRPLIETYLNAGGIGSEPSPSAARDQANSYGGGGGEADGGGGVSIGAKVSSIASQAMEALGGTDETPSYVVVDYLQSPNVIASLDQDGWLRARFANGDPDWYQALPQGASTEKLLAYWRNLTTTSIDITNGLITLDVRAFTAEDALAISQKVVQQSEALVNRMTERSRRDRLSGAEAQIKSAEARYLKAEAAMRQLRVEQGVIDPAGQAAGVYNQLFQLISARINLDVQLRMTAPGLDADAPQIKRIREQIAALDVEIEKAKKAVGDTGGSQDAAANYLSLFEVAETERQLASAIYGMAIDALEGARLETERQANYLAVFVPPYLPHHPAGSPATGVIGAVLLLALLIWGVLSMFLAAARDIVR